MTGYIMNFGVYTMAMIGIMVVALLVYKKSTTITSNETSLKIDDKIALNARKSLYVVNAGGERFLIAGDIDNTSLIARLGAENVKEVSPTTNSVKLTEESTMHIEEPVIKKQFISHEPQKIKLPEFKTEFSDAQKSLDEAFSNIDTMKFDKYLDVKNIRKKPVMKELAKKLAQI